MAYFVSKSLGISRSYVKRHKTLQHLTQKDIPISTNKMIYHLIQEYPNVTYNGMTDRKKK